MNQVTDYETDDAISMLYHALRAARRRCVIEIVANADDSIISVRSLAREVTAQEKNISVEHATGEPYRNVYTALSQTHLPTLADANILKYDPQRQTVESDSNLTVAALLTAISLPTIQMLHRKSSGSKGDSIDCINHRLSK